MPSVIRGDDNFDSAYAGITLLGTLSSLSGTSVTLSGLSLTNYKYLIIDLYAISMNAYAEMRVFANTNAGLIGTYPTPSYTYYQTVFVNLQSGTATASVAKDNLYNRQSSGDGAFPTSISTATTSLSFYTASYAGPSFDGGTIKVYGVA